MIDTYKRKVLINYTDVDINGKLNLVNSVSLIQNIMTEYFSEIKSDNLLLKEKNNAIWVVVKTKIHFNKYPKWRDILIGEAFTTQVKAIRADVETQCKDKDGNILFYADQEICVVDLDTRKIRKIDTVNYPLNIKTYEPLNKVNFRKLNEEFSEDEKVYEQKIYSTDIDYSRHMNNVFYVKYVLNTLPSSFFENNEITDFEIHYIKESKENQKLEVYRKVKDKEVDFLIKEGENEIVRAKLYYKNIN